MEILSSCALLPISVFLLSDHRQLAESAHINRTIRTGPYSGLDNDHSAVQVEMAIHEQFIGVERASSSSKKLVEMELKRRGLDTLGVKASVEVSWANFCSSEKQFTEITESPLSSRGRSDLTTPSTYDLYSSYFDQATTLTTPELIFLSGEENNDSVVTQVKLLEQEKASSFVKKARRLGISVQPHESSGAPSSASLFPLDLRKRVPLGFEQINDDLFCRKSNKFFVLNGAAVDTWDGTFPITKVFQPEDVYLNDIRR